MLQLKLLSGNQAGDIFVARRFPVRIGRGASCDLKLPEPGVWDEHLAIHLSRHEGLVMEVHPGALVTVNGQSAQRQALRNGDLLEIGALKMRFWIGEARQRGLTVSEWFVWLLVAATALLEVGLFLWLPR